MWMTIYYENVFIELVYSYMYESVVTHQYLNVYAHAQLVLCAHLTDGRTWEGLCDVT